MFVTSSLPQTNKNFTLFHNIENSNPTLRLQHFQLLTGRSAEPQRINHTLLFTRPITKPGLPVHLLFFTKLLIVNNSKIQTNYNWSIYPQPRSQPVDLKIWYLHSAFYTVRWRLAFLSSLVSWHKDQTNHPCAPLSKYFAVPKTTTALRIPYAITGELLTRLSQNAFPLLSTVMHIRYVHFIMYI